MSKRPLNTFGYFTQVVWRDIRRHTNGDTGAAIDQEVGEARRQDDRLLGATVIVRREIDGVFVDIANHLHGQLCHARFGVPHSRSRVDTR